MKFTTLSSNLENPNDDVISNRARRPAQPRCRKFRAGNIIVCSCVATLLLLTQCLAIYAQDQFSFRKSSSAVQYGYALKALLQFSGRKSEIVTFRLGISGGVGAFTGNNWFYPTLHADVMIYHSGLGSSWPRKIEHRSNFLDVEAIISYTFTTGWYNRMREVSSIKPGLRNYPLYYFSNWCFPALQNPYNYSVSWGGNWVAFLTRTPFRKNQLVGFLNVHVDRFQGNYLNDGPPFFLPFGDKYDRYHTGGGFITFHGDDDWAINLIELGYNKFTGYGNSTYEISNKLGNSYVYYPNIDQNYYNKSNWQLNVANTSHNVGATIELLNYRKLDMQHRIHTKGFYPFHLVPHPGFTSVGGVGYYRYTKIGLQ